MRLSDRMTIRSMWAQRKYLHYALTALAIAAFVPSLQYAQFPLKWDWPRNLSVYTILASRSVLVAAALYAVQSPGKAFSLIREHCWEDKPKLLMLAVFVALLFVGFGTEFAVIMFDIMFIAVFALPEILKRGHQRGKGLTRTAAALFPAAAYLFFGLILVFTYNNIIIRVRFYGAYDGFFNSLDARIFGTTVSELARNATGILPGGTLRALDFIYYGMFGQVGATLVICGISSGGLRARQFVSTILFSYFLALILFYIWPSHGPYYLNAYHAPYPEQKQMLTNAQDLWEQKAVHFIPMSYYIAFPCMHIAQPLIVLWFLKKWRRMVAVLLAYDVLLIGAILLLEWHYFVDLIGGAVVAGVAIFVVGYGPDTGKIPLYSPAKSRPTNLTEA